MSDAVNHNAQRRLAELLIGWEEDNLKPSELEELTVFLEQDPVARRALVNYSMMTAGISRHLAGRGTAIHLQPAGLSGSMFKVVAPLAAAAAMLVAVGAWLVGPGRPAALTARIESAASATLVRGSGTQMAQAGQELRDQDRIRTGPGGSAVLAYAGENTRIELGPNAELTLGPGSAGKRLHLSAGRLDASVARQPERRPMSITTSLAVATVLGTRFSLSAGEDATRLDVTEGRVEFVGNRAERPVVVAGGERAVAERDSGAIMRHGTVLFSQEFDQGFDDYDVYIEGADKRRLPAAPEVAQQRVRIVDGQRDGHAVKCLEVNSVGLGEGAYLLVAPRQRFEVADMALACDYMGVDPRGVANRINVGLEIGGGIGTFELTPIGQARGFRDKTWLPWTSFYRMSRAADGRQTLESRNDQLGQPLSRGWSVFDAGQEPTHFLLNIGVTGMRVLVDRVEVRRMEYVPAAAAGTAAGGPSPFRIESAASATVVRGAETLAASAGLSLRVGDRVRAERGGSAALVHAAGQARFELEESSELAVAGGQEVDLKAGRLAATAAFPAEAETLVVRTSQAVATAAAGARFTLSADVAKSRLDVTEGRVRLAGNRAQRPVDVRPGEFALAETDTGAVMLFGTVLFREEFERGLDGYDVIIDDAKNKRRYAADEAMRRRVQIVESTRDGRKVKCLEIDACGLDGTYLDVMSRMPPLDVTKDGLAVWVDYMGLRPTGRITEIEVGLHARAGEGGTFDVTPIGKPPKLSEGKWVDWLGTYWPTRAADGRFVLASRNYMYGRPAFRGTAAYSVGGAPEGLVVRLSAIGVKAVVDRVEIRRMTYVPASTAVAALFEDQFQAGLAKWQVVGMRGQLSPDEGFGNSPCLRVDVPRQQAPGQPPPGFAFPAFMVQEKDLDISFKYRWAGAEDSFKGLVYTDVRELPATANPQLFLKAPKISSSRPAEVREGQWAEYRCEIRDGTNIHQTVLCSSKLIWETRNQVAAPFVQFAASFFATTGDSTVYVDDVVIRKAAGSGM